MVAPTRVVFEGKGRSTTVNVINAGEEESTYRISLVNMRMSPAGKFEEIKEANDGEAFADKLIRFSPRQVTLAPGKSQVVRLALRKPAKLPAGEYRSHMVFREVPKDAGASVESLEKPSGIKIQLTAIIGISIPVIIRHGKTQASVAFEQVRYVPADTKENKPMLDIKLTRTGNQSVYGGFTAEYLPKEGEGVVVARVNGIAIYTPGNDRTLEIPLNVPAGVKMSKGMIKLTYRRPAEQGGDILAQTQVPLP